MNPSKFVLVIMFLSLCVFSNGEDEILKIVKKNSPKISSIGKNVKIPSPPTLQQIKSKTDQVTKLLDSLGALTQEKAEEFFPFANTMDILRSLKPATLEQLKRLIPEYQYENVIRHLNLQIDTHIDALQSIDLRTIQNLKAIKLPETQTFRKNYIIFDRDAFLKQLNLPTAEAIITKLNFTNKTEEIIKILKLRSLDEIKKLLPFHDIKSALNYYNVPTIENILKAANVAEIKQELLKIKKSFSKEEINRLTRNMRNQILHELNIPYLNDIKDNLDKVLSSEYILDSLGIKSRLEYEKRLAQSTGRSIIQKLYIPYKELVESKLPRVSPEALLVKAGIPTKPEILKFMSSFKRDKLIKLIGLPGDNEIKQLLDKYDPEKFFNNFYLPSVASFRKKFTNFEQILIDAINIPNQDHLKKSLENLSDPEQIIKALDLPTPDTVRQTIKKLADPDKVLGQLNLPSKQEIKKSLNHLEPKNILSKLGLPTENEIKDAINFINLKEIIKKANIPTLEELKVVFKVPDYEKYIRNLKLLNIDQIKAQIIKPEIERIMQDIGIPELDKIKSSVKNIGRNIFNDVIKELGIPTRDEWKSRLPKIDTKTLLKKLKLPTVDELEKLIPEINLDKFINDVVSPLKQKVTELKEQLKIDAILTKLGIPKNYDLKSIIPILDKDKFLDRLGIPDLDEMKKRLNISHADQIIKQLGLKSRAELKKLLPFKDVKTAIKELGIPNYNNVIKQIPIDQLLNEFNKIKSIPSDFRTKIKSLGKDFLEKAGVPELIDLRNKLKEKLESENILKEIGLPSQFDIENLFKKYTPDEILKRLNLPTNDKIKETLEKLKPENLINELGLPTKDIINNKLKELLNTDKLLKSIGLPTRDDLELILKRFEPDSLLKILNIPDKHALVNVLKEKLKVDNILRHIGIPDKQQLKKFLNIPNANEIIEKLGLPTPDILKKEIEKFSNPNNIIKKLGLPSLDKIKKELDIFKTDNILKHLGLPNKDELQKLIKIPDFTDIIKKAGFPTFSDLTKKLKIPNLDTILNKIQIPTIDELRDKFIKPKVNELLNNIGLPSISGIKDGATEYIKNIPVVKDILDIKDQYAQEIGTVVQTVGYIKDVIDMFKNPEKLPAIGQKNGAYYGAEIGGTIGSAIAGPIGYVIGSVVGAVLGGFIGRLIGGFFCSLFCARSDPPPDLTPPVVYCPANVEVSAAALKITANVHFARARASDNKYGDVSSTIRIDIMASFFMPKTSGNRYIGTNVPESTNYFRFHAWDGEKNHGWCDFHVTVRVLRCGEPPLIEHGSYFRSSLIFGSILVYYCNEGFSLDDSSLRYCKSPDKRTTNWSGMTPTCKVVTCSSPPPVANSAMNCVNDHFIGACRGGTCAVFTRCKYTCRDGYALPAGVPETIVCRSNGLWDDIPECRDIEEPAITHCPESYTLVVTDGRDYSENVQLRVPKYIDNSGSFTVSQTLGPKSGSIFTEGINTIAYSATDAAGNTNTKCSYTIKLYVPRCPVISAAISLSDINCTNGRSIGSTCKFECLDGFKLTQGHHAICRFLPNSHVAKWDYHKSQLPHCEPEVCQNLTRTENVTIECGEWMLGSFCEASCAPELAFNPLPPMLYSCPLSERKWLPTDKIPHCSPITKPLKVAYKLRLTDESDCSDKNQRISDDFQKSLKKSLKDRCDTCSIENMNLICHKSSGQGRRSVGNGVSVNMDIIDSQSLPSTSLNDFMLKRYQIISKLLSEIVVAQTEDYLSENVVEGNLTNVQRYRFPRYICPSGYISSKEESTCVACSRGYYYDSTTFTCVKCRKGFYQTHPGQLSCAQCPKHMSTPDVAADSASYCTDMCQKGEYSPTGVTPCRNCSKGRYQDEEGKEDCKTCPRGFLSDEGSTDISQCITYDLAVRPNMLDNRGFTLSTPSLVMNDFTISLWMRHHIPSQVQNIVSLSQSLKEVISVKISSEKVSIEITGHESVGSLPKDLRHWYHLAISYQSSSNKIAIFVNGKQLISHVISSNSSFTFTGVPTWHIFKGKCDAKITSLNIWKSVLSDQDIRSLAASCSVEKREGDILPWTDILMNSSAEPYLSSSSTCDDKDACLSSPCIHGKCTDQRNGYLCSCTLGFSGKRCENNIDDCKRHNCKNGASCIDGIGSYKCQCLPGFTGELCQLPVVHGGWGNWSEWGECSKTCGGGKQFRQRSCNNPSPSNGGNECPGSFRETRACNSDLCPYCSEVKAPVNGAFLCNKSKDDNDEELSCVAICYPGHKFSEKVPTRYTCGPSTGYLWTGQSTNRDRVFVLPSCNVIEIPREVSLSLKMSFSEVACNSDQEATDVGIAWQESVREKSRSIPCIEDGTCEVKDSVENCATGKRRRRSNDPVEVKMEVNQTVTIPQYFHSPQNSTNDLYNFLNETAQNLMVAVKSLETAGGIIKNDVENGNFSMKMNGREYVADKKLKISGSARCPEGSEQRDTHCVACSPGTYLKGTYCVPCEVGMYQPDGGKSSCIKCPVKQTTMDKGSRDLSQCTVYCDRGEYKDGDKCILCPIGSYQPMFQKSQCVQCPAGQTTNSTGSIDGSDCYDMCKPGTYRSQNTCIKCDKNTYQPLHEQKLCLRCPDGLVTQSKGSAAKSSCEASKKTSSPVIAIAVGVSLAVVALICIGAVVYYFKHRGKLVKPEIVRDFNAPQYCVNQVYNRKPLDSDDKTEKLPEMLSWRITNGQEEMSECQVYAQINSSEEKTTQEKQL